MTTAQGIYDRTADFFVDTAKTAEAKAADAHRIYDRTAGFFVGKAKTAEAKAVDAHRLIVERGPGRQSRRLFAFSVAISLVRQIRSDGGERHTRSQDLD